MKAKTIDTLVADIYNLLDKPNKEMEFDIERQAKLGSRIVRHIVDEIRDPDRTDRNPNEIYVTQLTSNCEAKNWYSIFGNKVDPPIPRETVKGDNRFKFLYGDLIEEAVLYLAEMAGHTVEYQQERLSIPIERTEFILSGRIDAVIDGWLVDVKSMEQYSFARIVKDEYEDKWGYYDQLGMYWHMMNEMRASDILCEYPAIKGVAILAVNKTNGKVHLHKLPKWVGPENYEEFFEFKLPAMLNGTPLVTPWRRTPELTTKSGNEVLAAKCSYCPYKIPCFAAHGGLEIYAYSDGPTFIPKPVKRPPKVPVITEVYIKEHLQEQV